MDKLSDIIITMMTASIAGLAWILKRLFKRIDDAHHRIDKLDKLVDQTYLETQLAPIRGEVSLILKTLLYNIFPFQKVYLFYESFLLGLQRVLYLMA